MSSTDLPRSDRSPGDVSSTVLLAGYLRERYPARTFVPLALVLAIAGLAAAGGPATGGPATVPPILPVAARAVVLALLLVLLFRLWDDLEDRARDRVEHPERLLARDGRTTPFLVLLGAIAAVAAALLATSAHGTPRLATLAALAAVLLGWYRIRARLGAPAVLGAHVVLAKYPVIAWVAVPAAGQPAAAVLPPLLVVYLALCVHEALHDRRVRGATGGGVALALDAVLLCATLPWAVLPHLLPGAPTPFPAP